jgi:hypothetical protein
MLVSPITEESAFAMDAFESNFAGLADRIFSIIAVLCGLIGPKDL